MGQQVNIWNVFSLRSVKPRQPPPVLLRLRVTVSVLSLPQSVKDTVQELWTLSLRSSSVTAHSVSALLKILKGRFFFL